MPWIARNIHHLMTVSGVLTLTMTYAAIAPQSALVSTFGAGLDGPAANVVVRNWGALIGLMGAMLIYAARKPELRPLALCVAGAGKAIFILLVVAHGRRFLAHQAGMAVAVDLVWVIVFAAYLMTLRKMSAATVSRGTMAGV